MKRSSYRVPRVLPVCTYRSTEIKPAEVFNQLVGSTSEKVKPTEDVK